MLICTIPPEPSLHTQTHARTHTHTMDVTEGIYQNIKPITPLDSCLCLYREEKNAYAMYITLVAGQNDLSKEKSNVSSFNFCLMLRELRFSFMLFWITNR